MSLRGGLALLLCGLAGLAQAEATPEAMTLLRRIYQATEKLSYEGTFVYLQGERSETSRIAHAAGAGGDIEKLEVLDGTPREVVRTRDVVRWYLPDSHTVKVERRTDPRSFPGMLPERMSDLARSYAITRSEPLRIAGFDCESVLLMPVDDLRYGYKLWADVNTGMLLKARTFNRRSETVEQFTFTQLSIGTVSRDKVRPRHAARSWRIEDAAVVPANLALAGWTINADLPGFRKTVEVSRKLGDSRPVEQVVYSDGLTALSVFIEPMGGRAEPVRPGLSSKGAFHIYTREVANHIVTVVGEAPAASVQRIANTVAYRRPQ